MVYVYTCKSYENNDTDDTKYAFNVNYDTDDNTDTDNTYDTEDDFIYQFMTQMTPMTLMTQMLSPW